MKKIILIFLICYVNFAFASELTVNFVLKNLHKNYDNVTSFKAEFKQISFFKSVNSVQEFKGTLYLKKPDKMRWDYTFPETQLIVSNGEKIWYYYPKDNQVNVGNISKNNKEKNLIFMLLDGITKVEKQFNITMVKGKNNKDYIYLQLLPKKPNTLFDKIIITLYRKNFKIAKSYIFYLTGDISKLIFLKTYLNVKLSNAFFNFKPPAGCEVFQMPSY